MVDLLKGEDLEKELSGRDPLTGSIQLFGEKNNDNQSISDEFEIEGVLHAGGSCICYKAKRIYENGEKEEIGTLKEFYPVDSENSAMCYNLKRRDIDAGNLAKQLYSELSTLENFENALHEFEAAHTKILELQKKDSEKHDNFFTKITIYRGIADSDYPENHTLYIWCPGNSALISFDDHLAQMYEAVTNEIENPTGNVNLFLANELHTVLQAIEILAVGIEYLHCENLLHLDIKPSNFGIRTYGTNDGDHVSVSMFDINTIYSRTNPLARTGGTPYFRAPEMIDSTINSTIDIGVLSDVYSLGATLYNAVILTSGGRGLYDWRDFANIDAALSHSLLMEYSEYNSKAELHDILATILKRSLARAAKNYKNGIKNYQRGRIHRRYHQGG